jgi:lipopolysaccharide transport system permease protein
VSASKHANLTATFVLRELRTGFTGSLLGPVWIWAGPLLTLGVYAFVFGSVFKVNAQSIEAPSYLAFVAIGLWPWMIFADGLTKGMVAIQANANLVKKISFDHATLVYAAIIASAAMHIAGYVLILAALVLFGGVSLSPTLLCLPFTIVTIMIFTCGLALLLAALQTVLRDVEQAVPAVLMMVYFMTPVLYPAKAIPQPYREWLSWNPLAMFVTRVREQVLGSTAFAVTDIVNLLVALLTFAVGYAVFQRLSPHFEDFL